MVYRHIQTIVQYLFVRNNNIGLKLLSEFDILVGKTGILFVGSSYNSIIEKKILEMYKIKKIFYYRIEVHI